jgi:thiamine biosynthesis lipoprotein
MSTWETTSDLSRYNTSPTGWQTMPPACFDVIACAMAVAKDSTGAYDPTVGPLVNLWGFGPDPARRTRPDAADIAAARARCGWWRIELDPGRQAVLQPGGVYIDLSAIAKGYGVDAVADYLRAVGCTSFLVEVGGELLGEGVKADGQPWWVELEHPAEHVPEPLIAALHGLAVATSGDYRRCFFDSLGRRYAHTIDPRTGLPTAHDTASVSVLHPRCILADALSTALMVMGSTEGMAYAERHDIAALFIDRQHDRYVESMSPAMTAMLD